jgi:hypothetical protein
MEDRENRRRLLARSAVSDELAERTAEQPLRTPGLSSTVENESGSSSIKRKLPAIASTKSTP